MAIFKTRDYVKQDNSQEFEKFHKPAAPAPHAGIYRCEGCGREVAVEKGVVFPMDDHPLHAVTQGPVKFRLLVLAQR